MSRKYCQLLSTIVTMYQLLIIVAYKHESLIEKVVKGNKILLIKLIKLNIFEQWMLWYCSEENSEDCKANSIFLNDAISSFLLKHYFTTFIKKRN